MKKARILFIVIVGLLIFSTLLSAFVRNIYLNDKADEKWGALGKGVKFLAELPSTVKKGLQAPEFMVRNDSLEQDLSIINRNGMDTYPKLLYSYKKKPFEQKFALLDIATGREIKSWSPDNKKLYDLGYNEDNPQKPPKGSDLYFMHPLMTKDSSLIFNSQLTSLLAKIDKDNSIVWTKNDRRYHHTQEMDHEGNLYVCTQPFESGKYDILPENYDVYKSTLIDDEITKLNPETGKILYRKSIIQILIDNGYENVLLGKGQFISDMIHLNDIQPALTDTDYWQKGDLLISCRNICAVFLYRPATNKVIWFKEGPWYNQHDADFIGESKIMVFGNDVIREESVLDPKVTQQPLFFNKRRKNNQIYIYDFEKDTVTTPYDQLLESEKIRTITSGRCDMLLNGDIFVEDTNNGRIIFGDSIQKKAEFIKRIDKEHISSLFWSRLIYN